MIIYAPWTEEQVIELNKYQKSKQFHPYTCSNDSKHRELVATKNGWICLDCKYIQNWCHEILI